MANLSAALKSPDPNQAVESRVTGGTTTTTSMNDRGKRTRAPAPEGAGDTKSRKLSKQQAAFQDAVNHFDPATVVAELRRDRVSAKTSTTYSPAEILYRMACEKADLPPWPATETSLEIFAGYLKKSGAYASPATYWWGVVHLNKDHGGALVLPKTFVTDTLNALERGLPPQEQCEPLTIPVLRKLGSAVVTVVDFITVLALVGALFAVARADCFLSLGPDDISDVGPDRVRVSLTKLKGETRQAPLEPVFERFTEQTGDLAPIHTALGVIQLDPVSVFRTLRERARAASAPSVAQCRDYTRFMRCLKDLLSRAGVPPREDGRKRDLYSCHSTRVAAVCYLLKSGLAEPVIKILANWSSDQLSRYGKRVALDPGIVTRFPFYNPSLMQDAYGGPTGESESKAEPRRNKRADR